VVATLETNGVFGLTHSSPTDGFDTFDLKEARALLDEVHD
jgi:hypothetical protein